MSEYTQHDTLERILRGLATAIRFLEDINSILSSVLISLALTIAVMDLVTGGSLLQHLPMLVYLWAGSVAVGVEATLVSAFDRAHQAWLEMRRWQAAQWLGLGVLLAVVGFVGVSGFTLENSLHVNEVTALQMMHLSPLAFDLGRSALTVLLACVAGITRPRKKPVTHADRKRELTEAIELEPLKQRLEAMRGGNKKAQAKKPHGPTFPTGGTPAQMQPETAEQTAGQEYRPAVLRLPNPARYERRHVSRAKLTLREKVFKALDEDASLSGDDLARRFRKGASTCARYRSEWLRARAEVQMAR